MSQAKRRNDIKKWLPGAIVSLGLIAFILYRVDLPATLNDIRKADYRLLLLAAALNILWLLLRAQVWRTLLRNRPTYRDVFLTMGEGYLMNNFLPFRLGEVGRVFLLSRKTSLRFGEILPTVVVERGFDLVIAAMLLLLSVPYLTDSGGAERTGVIVGGIIIGILVTMFVFTRNQARATKLFHALSQRLPGLQRLGDKSLQSVFNGLSVLNDGWLFVQFLFLILLNWFTAVLQYYLIVKAFFPQASPVWGLFVLAAASLGGAIPSLPGAVGTLEAAVGGAVILLAGDGVLSTALALGLTVRLYNYLFSGLIGIYGLSTEGETLSSMYQQLKTLRTREATEA